jgi:hypothetical protein
MTQKIYIFGAGGAGEHLLKFLRDDVEVLGFLDNSEAKWGSEFCGLPVFAPAALRNGGYDRVVVCSAYHPQIVPQLVGELGVPEEMIVNTHALFHDHYFRSRLDAFAPRAREVRCLVTGISYAMLGIVESRMPMPTFNFAMNGQDLYYDAKIWEHVLDNHPVDNLEFALLGLTRYSLHYDLSKRKNDMVTRYAHLLGDYHHGQATRDKVERAYQVMTPEYMESIYRRQRSVYDDYFRNIHKGNYTQLKANPQALDKMAQVSSREHLKFYPATVKENTAVLDRLIGRLKARGLTPVLFNVPGHPSYTAGIPQGIEAEFLQKVEAVTRTHGVPFLDMLRAPEFNDGHYYDDSHLNEDGGFLFTDMLARYLRDLKG